MGPGHAMRKLFSKKTIPATVEEHKAEVHMEQPVEVETFKLDQTGLPPSPAPRMQPPNKTRFKREAPEIPRQRIEQETTHPERTLVRTNQVGNTRANASIPNEFQDAVEVVADSKWEEGFRGYNMEKLKGRENYDSWKIAARSYFLSRDLWYVIEKDTSIVLPKTNARLIGEITLMLEPRLYNIFLIETVSKCVHEHSRTTRFVSRRH